MKRFSVARRTFGRRLVLLSMLLCAFDIASTHVGWRYYQPVGMYDEIAVVACDGVLTVRWGPLGFIPGLPTRGIEVIEGTGSWGLSLPYHGPLTIGYRVVVPIWFIVLPLALVGIHFWASLGRARRFPPDCCQSCGHGLRGCLSGRCTECGASTVASTLLVTGLPQQGWANYWRFESRQQETTSRAAPCPSLHRAQTPTRRAKPGRLRRIIRSLS